MEVGSSVSSLVEAAQDAERVSDLCERLPGHMRVRKGVAVMTPAEVLAMRDRLAEWLMTEKENPSRDMAEALIASGWVTSEPERRYDD